MQEAERFGIQIPDFHKRDERPTLFLPLRHSTVAGTRAIGRIVDCRDNRSRSRLMVAAGITSPQLPEFRVSWTSSVTLLAEMAPCLISYVHPKY
jgi:hypothetical protein